MKIEDFSIERWIGSYIDKAAIDLTQTCIAPLSIKELLSMLNNGQEALEDILETRLSYEGVGGYLPLRQAIGKLYKNINPENITITHGGIGANALVFYGLVEHQDRIIATSPTYQQHYSLPRALGADVKILDLKPENQYQIDLDQLKSYINEKTKLICLCNPNNPTGTIIEKNTLMEIIDIARKHNIYILCDEAYRGLNHREDIFEDSIVDLYEKGISTSSVSKSLSLAGLRIGWIAASKEIIDVLHSHKDYNTICGNIIDEKIAFYAFEYKEKIIEKNMAILRNNIKLLDDWVRKEKSFSYIKPQSGTTAFLKMHFQMPSEEFSLRLLAEKRILLIPGTAFDREGFVRIGYACDTETLRKGLEGISEFIKTI